MNALTCNLSFITVHMNRHLLGGELPDPTEKCQDLQGERPRVWVPATPRSNSLILKTLPQFLELSLLVSKMILNVEGLCYSLKALPCCNSPLKSWDYHTSYFNDITCLIPGQMKPTQELSTRLVSCEKRCQHCSRQFSLRDARKIFSPQISPVRGYF